MPKTIDRIPDDVREQLTRASGNYRGTWTPMAAAIDALRKARGLPPDTSSGADALARFKDLIESGDVDLDRETRAVARDILAGRLLPPLTRAEARELIARRIDGMSAPAPAATPVRRPKLSAESRAIAALHDHPDATDTEIARRAGVARTSLYAMPNFRKAREYVRSALPPRGVRTDDGNVDAWNDSDE